jgi:hypothetical protein
MSKENVEIPTGGAEGGGASYFLSPKKNNDKYIYLEKVLF